MICEGSGRILLTIASRAARPGHSKTSEKFRSALTPLLTSLLTSLVFLDGNVWDVGIWELFGFLTWCGETVNDKPNPCLSSTAASWPGIWPPCVQPVAAACHGGPGLPGVRSLPAMRAFLLRLDEVGRVDGLGGLGPAPSGRSPLCGHFWWRGTSHVHLCQIAIP